MKLYLQTDVPPRDQAWLRYILDSFCNINQAEFEIELLPFSEGAKLHSPVINYALSATKALSLPRLSDVSLSSKITWLGEAFFILENTNTDASGFAMDFDPLWNAFVFLSRYEEWDSEKKGKAIHSYAARHPREDKKSFDIPIVNLIFDQLQTLIESHFPELTFGQEAQFEIELSHDLDYIEKTWPLRLKQTAFNAFNSLKNIHRPAIFWKHFKRTFFFLFSNPSYWCFDYWEEMEKKYGKSSVFYVYAKMPSSSFKKWLLDPGYDVASDEKLQQKLKYLIKEGFEIGLHGSFESAMDAELLQQEKEILEKAIGSKVCQTRQHWLRYTEEITPYLHEKLFEIDSTLGWNDRVGFRAGCASAYKPYLHREQRVAAYTIVPQLVMDSNLYDYASGKPDEIVTEIKAILGNLRQHKNIYLAISWHPRTCSTDYNWHVAYEELLEFCFGKD